MQLCLCPQNLKIKGAKINLYANLHEVTAVKQQRFIVNCSSLLQWRISSIDIQLNRSANATTPYTWCLNKIATTPLFFIWFAYRTNLYSSFTVAFSDEPHKKLNAHLPFDLKYGATKIVKFQNSWNFSAQLYNVSIHNYPDKVEVSFCLTSLFCFLIVLIFLRNYDKVNYANTRQCTRQSSSVHVEDRHYCEYALLINHVDVYRSDYKLYTTLK